MENSFIKLVVPNELTCQYEAITALEPLSKKAVDKDVISDRSSVFAEVPELQVEKITSLGDPFNENK